jgi:signal transduction histidine kinase
MSTLPVISPGQPPGPGERKHPPDILLRVSDVIRRVIFLRPGLRLALILAVSLFALVIGLASALFEIGSTTRLEVNAAVSRAELGGHLIMSQIGLALQNAPEKSARESISQDLGVERTMTDVRQLIPGVGEVAIVDTAGRIIVMNPPGELGAQVTPREELHAREGLNAVKQGFWILRAHEPWVVSVPFELNGVPFGAIRVLIQPSLMREELGNAFLVQLVKLGVQVVLATLFGIAISWLVVLRPLGRIGAGLGNIARGEFHHRLPVDTYDEMGKLARQVNDLSEFMAREQERILQERGAGDALRRLVDAVDDGLLMIDMDRTILMANRTTAQLLNTDFDTLVGKNLLDLLPRQHPLIGLVDAAFREGGRLDAMPVEFQTPAGPKVLLAACERARNDGTGGEAEGTMITLRDYGRVQRIQELMDHARVLSRLGKMAAGVAHEIRNPLNAMNIHLELLKQKLPASRNGGGEAADGGRRHAELAQREIARLERVVSGFLRLARLQELSLSRIEVGTFLDELVELVQPEARISGIDLRTDVAPGLSDLYGDEEVLRQAFLNLIRNAIQASPRGSGPITISASPDNRQVRISVQDHGPGMSQEVQERAFDLYFTTRREGSGIGLALVQQAVEMHGGRIELVSRPGQGTTFTIRLPAFGPEPARH